MKQVALLNLKGCIVAKYGSVRKFCEAKGQNYATLSNIIRTGKGLSISKMKILIDDLEIPHDTLYSIFFE